MTTEESVRAGAEVLNRALREHMGESNPFAAMTPVAPKDVAEEAVRLGIEVRFCHECQFFAALNRVEAAKRVVEVVNEGLQSLVIKTQQTPNGLTITILPRTAIEEGPVVPVKGRITREV